MTQYLIAANADDGNEFDEVWTSTGDLFAGFRGGFDDPTIGLWFQNISAPPGSAITSATLNLYSKSVYKEPDIRAYCVDLDNSAIMSVSNMPFGQPRTAAYDSHDFTGEANPTGYGDINAYITFDLTAAFQEVVDRLGWSDSNNLAIVLLSAPGQPFDRWGGFADSEAGASTEPTLDIVLSANPGIASVDGNDIIQGDKNGVIIVGANLAGVTQVRAKYGGVTETFTPTGTTATTVTFDFVQGDLPWGLITFEVFDGTNTGTRPVTLITPATTEYVTLLNPSTGDAASVFNGATHTPLTGDLVENTEIADVTIQANATFSIVNGSVITSFDVRSWRSDTEQWTSWVTMTLANATLLAGTVTGNTAFNISLSITLASVLAECIAGAGGALAIDSVSPGGNCASAVINGANIDIVPDDNVSGVMVVNYVVSEVGEGTANGVINITIAAADPSQSHVRVFPATSTVELDVTRGSNNLTDNDQKVVTVT